MRFALSLRFYQRMFCSCPRLFFRRRFCDALLLFFHMCCSALLGKYFFWEAGLCWYTEVPIDVGGFVDAGRHLRPFKCNLRLLL